MAIAVAALGPAGMLCAGGSPAEAGRVAAKPAESPQTQAMRTLETAYRVARWGRANRDPHALILAAQMLGEEGARTLPAGRVAGGTGPARALPAMTREGMLAEARVLANGDRAVLARIAVAAASASKGSFPRPARVVRDIPAHGVWTGTESAEGARPYRAAAVGDGDTYLQIEVLDEKGARLCKDASNSYVAGCSFTPDWTIPVTIRVTNLGSIWTRVAIMTSR